jgi:hypothetical protein
MRQHRILVVLAIAGGLCVPRDAAAFCELFGPYLGTGPQLPRGCPLHVYSLPAPPGVPTPPQSPAPMITVLRNGTYIDATGAYNTTNTNLLVEMAFTDCEGSVTNMTRMSTPYQHFEILTKADVQVGEQIGFGRGWFTGIEIAAAGACPAPVLPTPACTEMPFCMPPPPFDDFESGGGCAAGGGGGLAIGLALLGAIRWAPRRRRR